MRGDSFFKFCNNICDTVGRGDEFRPENSLASSTSEYQGAVKMAGEVVCGEEVRAAIFIRLLAGASYIDLMVIFDLTHGSIFGCFQMVCGWVLRTFTLPLIKALQQDEDEEYLEEVSTSSFAYSGARDIQRLYRSIGWFGNQDQ
jgi:hypothetical protein